MAPSGACDAARDTFVAPTRVPAHTTNKL